MYIFIASLLTLVLIVAPFAAKPSWLKNKALEGIYIGAAIFTAAMWVNIIIPGTEQVTNLIVTIMFCLIFLRWLWFILIPKGWRYAIKDFISDLFNGK